MVAAKDWESRLERGWRLWQGLQTKAQPVEAFVEQATGILEERGDDTQNMISSHKVSVRQPNNPKTRPFIISLWYD